MSINPASTIEPSNTIQTNASADRRAPVVEKDTVQPSSERSPKTEPGTPSSSAAAPPLAQDEVEVQRDSGANGAIVIKYVDKFGHVVFQVPSSEVLGVAQAIDQELAMEAKARANPGQVPPSAEGEENHGN